MAEKQLTTFERLVSLISEDERKALLDKMRPLEGDPDARSLESDKDPSMNADEIVIKGRFLESYLDRRLIKATTYYTGNAEDSIRSIISNMVAIPLLELGTDHGLTETLVFQAVGG